MGLKPLAIIKVLPDCLYELTYITLLINITENQSYQQLKEKPNVIDSYTSKNPKFLLHFTSKPNIDKKIPEYRHIDNDKII